jgi:hypothetical protein
MLLAGLSGCSTYYSHYGTLTAENAAGKTRDFTISWESVESPGWLGGIKSTPLLLEGQCSERTLVFRDAEDPLRTCGGSESGIFWCGAPGQDLLSAGSEQASAKDVCGVVRDSGAAARIGDLSSRIQLTINCWPAESEVQRGEDKVSIDYLRASPVPYQFSVKKVLRGSLDDRKPIFDMKACKES